MVQEANSSKTVCFQGLLIPQSSALRFLIIFGFSVFLCNIYGQEKVNFFNLEWRDANTEIEEAHVDDKIIIKFETESVSDNEIIDIEIWEKTDGKLMDFIKKLQGTVKNGIVEIDWVIEFDTDNENTNYACEIKKNSYTIIDYVFLVKYNDINISSKLLAILAWWDRRIIDERTGEPIRNREFMLYSPDGKFLFGETDDEGHAKMRNLRIIGSYSIII